jgi:N-formylglutamate deformylase
VVSNDRLYPQWVVLHVPHDSTDMPSSVRGQFLLNNIELATELDSMTDHHTLALFADAGSEGQVVRAPVSRLVVDVERFAQDDDEPMASRGMGAIYTVTSHLSPLRRPLTAEERNVLMRNYYIPHHQRLESAVASAIDLYDRCLVVDCHSFPDRPLPYELADPDSVRPDICIGADDFHTSEELLNAFVTEFRRIGWTVSVNDPFSGALVPGSRYRRDRRVKAVMVEVNRRLYLHEASADPLPDFSLVSQQVKRCCMAAIEAFTFTERAPGRIE